MLLRGLSFSRNQCMKFNKQDHLKFQNDCKRLQIKWFFFCQLSNVQEYIPANRRRAWACLCMYFYKLYPRVNLFKKTTTNSFQLPVWGPPSFSCKHCLACLEHHSQVWQCIRPQSMFWYSVNKITNNRLLQCEYSITEENVNNTQSSTLCIKCLNAWLSSFYVKLYFFPF